MKTIISLLVLAASTCWWTLIFATEGETSYSQICASCHGEKAEGNDNLGSPALAAQNSEYIVRQLSNYNSGLRGTHSDDTFGQQMSAMAKTVADPASQQKIADFLSTLVPVKVPLSEGDTKNGFKYYQSCGSCHGAKAQGNPALSSPRLAGLSTAYLARQYQHFNAGLRGTHTDDRYGRQMKMMAGTLPDEATLKDVLAYISSITQ
ncbi:MAG: cytochrome c553 [Cryomorphaceae bacterium]